MLLLAVGLALFFAVHVLPTRPELRQGLLGRFGETAYKLGFAAVSLAGLALIVVGYHKLQLNPGKNPILWTTPLWLRHGVLLAMLPALILLVAAYVPSRIRTAVRHPMLAAVKLWALAHLAVNGDLGSLLLFGGFLAYGVYDRISVQQRQALGPLGASTGGLGGDVAVVAIGAALWYVMLKWGHAWLIGVPAL